MAAQRDLQIYSAMNLRGLDIKTSPPRLAIAKDQNYLRKASNCVFPTTGGVSKRFDQTTLTSSSVGASVAITGGIEFKKSDGTRQVIFGTNDGKLIKLNTRSEER